MTASGNRPSCTMQEQTTSVQSSPEPFEFNHGSNSSDSGMNQHIYLNNQHLHAAENQNLSGYVISPGSANVSCADMANQDGVQLSIWSSGGQPSNFVQHSHNQGNSEETKIEPGCRSPLRDYAGGSSRIEEICGQPDTMLCLENARITLNTTQADDGKSFLRSSILNEPCPNSEYAAHAINNEISASRPSAHSRTSGLSDPEHVPSSNSSTESRRSSLGVGSVQEDDGRPGSSSDGRRFACKRKNFEALPQQSSARGTASSSDQAENRLLHSACYGYNPDANPSIPSSSGYLSIVNLPEYHQPSFGTIARGIASECDYSASAAGDAESLRRNFVARINHGEPRDISSPRLWSASTARHRNMWSQSQPSSHSIRFNQPLEPRPALATSSSQNHPHAPVVHGLCQTAYHFPWSGAADSRIGRSSSSSNSEERVITTREETNPSIMTMNSSEGPISVTDIGHMTREPTNWTFGGSSIGISGNVAPTSRVGPNLDHPSRMSSWVSHQIPPSQYTRSSPVSIHQSLFPSGSSDAGGQRTNVSVQHSCNSFSSLETQQIRANLHGPQPAPRIRSTNMTDWQNDSILGAPLTIRRLGALSEQRSRMMLEIHHALESMRRWESLRFETVILAGMDLHDRHRDMRLDVDNMTYEELLALEERIGNVSTGLNEETVLKCLKQRKYLFKASEEDEPCCICQEEYVEGEDLGTLDCGHNFHTFCIKQWLTCKNLCPICKNAALVT